MPCNGPPTLSGLYPNVGDQKLRTPMAAFEFSVPLETAFQDRTVAIDLDTAIFDFSGTV
jgi:hypothetical protein